MFPKPRPANLITVPACDTHHSNARARDNELFRFQLAIHIGAQQSPSARAVWPSIIRSLARREAAGWQQTVFGTLGKRPVRTPAGLYIGNFPSYELSIPRLHAEAEWIIRGLYFAHRRTPVPADREVHVFAGEIVRRMRADVRQSFAPLIAFVQAVPAIVIGNRAFRYYFRTLPEDASCCLVALIFYEAFSFFGWVMPETEADVCGVQDG